MTEASLALPPSAEGLTDDEGTGYWAQALHRLLHDPSAVVGGILVIVAVLAALVGPPAYGRDPNFIEANGLTLNGDPRPPSSDFPLGTDTQGRDELARVLNGAKVSLGVSFLAVSFAAVLGLAVGGFAGIGAPLTRELLMRSVDVLLSFPVLLLGLVVLSIARPSVLTIAVVIGIGWGAYLARIVYGIVGSLAGRDLTASAIAIGASRLRILVRHLLPHALPAVIVYVTLGIGVAIQLEAIFGYVGAGLPQPDATWGNMIADAQSYIVSAPRLVFVPAAAIMVVMLGFTLLGDGLRHALDPREQLDRGDLGARRA